MPLQTKIAILAHYQQNFISAVTNFKSQKNTVRIFLGLEHMQKRPTREDSYQQAMNLNSKS